MNPRIDLASGFFDKARFGATKRVSLAHCKLRPYADALRTHKHPPIAQRILHVGLQSRKTPSTMVEIRCTGLLRKRANQSGVACLVSIEIRDRLAQVVEWCRIRWMDHEGATRLALRLLAQFRSEILFRISREPFAFRRCPRGAIAPGFILWNRALASSDAEPNERKWKAANQTFASNSPEAPMAVKNMQKLEMRGVKVNDVGVTGMVCKGSQRTDGRFQAPIQSAVRLPLPGPYPIVSADAVLCGDANPETAKAERTGRSASKAGVFAGATLARSASGTMRSTWSASLFAEHRKPRTQSARG